MINRTEPNGNSVYRLLQHLKNLKFGHTVYPLLSYDFHNNDHSAKNTGSLWSGDSLQASTAKQMRSAIFWNVTQRMLVFPYRRFGTTYWSHLQRPRSPDMGFHITNTTAPYRTLFKKFLYCWSDDGLFKLKDSHTWIKRGCAGPNYNRLFLRFSP